MKNNYVWFSEDLRKKLDNSKQISKKEVESYLKDFYGEDQQKSMKKLDLYIFPGKTGLAVVTPSEESQQNVVKNFGNVNEVRKESDNLFKYMLKEYVDKNNQKYQCSDIVVHDGGIDVLANEVISAITSKRKVNPEVLDRTIKPYNAVAGLLGIIS